MSTAQKRKASGEGVAPAKRPNLDYTESITVLAGPEEISFQVYKNVICAKSKFFEAACKKRWNAGKEKLIRLPELSPYSFTVYLHWIHTGTIAYEGIGYDPPFQREEQSWVAGKGRNKGLQEKANANCHFFDVFCAYIIGDVLQDISLCNHAVTECIRQKEHACPSGSAIAYAWANTPQNSHLHKWIIDAVSTTFAPKSFAEEAAKFPADCVLEMAKYMVAYMDYELEDSGRNPTLQDACKYHDHSTDFEECPYAPKPKVAPTTSEDGSSSEEESSDEGYLAAYP